MDIIEEYAKISYMDARGRLAQRFRDGSLPTEADIKTRRAFDNEDHWQNGDGFIGQIPTGDHADDRTDLLRKAFSPEDVISEVLDTHAQNVLGNEPAITVKTEEGEPLPQEVLETLETVKTWFAKRDGAKTLAEALRAARRESASVLRAFIPSGMINGEGRITANDLEDALSKIWIRAEPIERGGVIVDEATATELGLYEYRMRVGNTDVSLIEYAYLDEQNRTVWGTASAHQQGEGAEKADSLLLNGKLPIFQMNAPALITNSVCQAQRAVNLSGTMLTRNNNLAGSRERLAVGVTPPGHWVKTVQEDGTEVNNFQAVEMATGPGTMNFLQPDAVRDENGNITAFANPNITFTDPVAIDTFIGTSTHWRKVIYAKAKMIHLLMSDDATASGKSRIEARREFQASLNESKQLVDAAGKWMLEIALNIAAHFINRPGEYLNVDITFDAEISTIELTPEEIAQIRDDYESGMIDLETALTMRGFKDVQTIMERLGPTEDEAVLAARRQANG